MKSERIDKQFDLVLVALDPAVGSEQRGTRQCVVLQTNGFEGGRTVLVAPLTTKKLERIYTNEVEIGLEDGVGIKEPSKMKTEQIKVIDKKRIKKHLGSLHPHMHKKIRDAVEIIFDLKGFYA